MIVLALVAILSWRYSQAASIDEESLPPIAYRSELTTPILSARRVPETLQRPLADAALAPELATILSASGPASCLIVREDGRTLQAANALLPLVPASNQKILSTYAILSQYGPNHTFETHVAASAPLQNGQVVGDLYLIGGGDPFLSTQAWRSQYGDDQEGRTFSRLEDLADAVVATGVGRVTGSVVGDESLFDTERYGPWAERLIVSQQSGPLSALSVNEGFSAWPEEFGGSPRGRTAAPNPALNAAEVFQALLAERGVTILGSPDVSPAPTQATVVARLVSPPLAQLVTHINSYSNNYGAEILVKYLGRNERGIGSTAAGVAEIQSILELQRFDLSGVTIVDGSGLAETNRLTCAVVTEILQLAGSESVLVDSFSIGGERGSLATKHEGTPAEGNVYAKTGTLNGVTALSGVVESAREDDVDLLFSYIVNGDSVGLNEELKGLQIPLVEALATYPNAPLISALSPK
ncbi:MAG: D-alanyl-D-alanine carboxypeptidase/D-alanyl-D-alanine-endopeptidase [Acidimicrobiia bacterium]|nr:D-alanyl-D-alanine carboxypeptidase/D-alanyl-D-alanine-endopeptidase [Acidimicrobiia bacterium]